MKASKNVVVHEAQIGDRVYLFFANFDGLQAGVKATPAVQQNIEVRVPLQFGASCIGSNSWAAKPCWMANLPGRACSAATPNLDSGAVASDYTHVEVST